MSTSDLSIRLLGEERRVLVVDDEPLICDLLREYLTLEGFVVTVAGSAEQALEHLNRGEFDVVLTDLKLPGKGGLDLLQHVETAAPECSTIIMTGYGTAKTAVEAMKVGAFDYILKPFKPAEVAELLERCLRERQLTRENVELRESMGFYELCEALSSTAPLDQQLGMVETLCRTTFGVDHVTIMLEDTEQPGHYVDMAQNEGPRFGLRMGAILSAFSRGLRINTRGQDVGPWLDHPAAGAVRVHAFMAVPLTVRGHARGILGVFSTAPRPPFTEGQRKGLAIIASRAAGAIDTARLYQDLSDTFTQTMEGFARALEAKDAYTHGHSDRVAMYAAAIARVMGASPADRMRIRHGGLMHDIGKIGVASSDLNKPQKLTAKEYALFMSHPAQGRRIIEPIRFLVPLVPCVYHHHESWDGRGYPEGLGGTDIPWDARVLAVADTYDAMTSDRPYRKALPHDIALSEFKRCRGRQFDPTVVEAFLEAIGPLRRKRIARGTPVPE